MSEARAAESRSSKSSDGDWARRTALGLVSLGVAMLLIAGAIVRGRPAPPVGMRLSNTLVASVALRATIATVWNCPGPLPVSGGSTASVAVANPSPHTAAATVLVAESAVLPGALTGRNLRTQLEKVSIAAFSELELPIVAEPVSFITEQPSPTKSHRGSTARKTHKRYPVVDAAVSVTVTGAGVGVSEQESSHAGIVASPCTLGSGPAGYTASGVTAGSSNLHVAIFDPSAAPAVVNISVGTGSGIVQPQAYQGLVIAPKSLAVLNLAQYVPQQTAVAVAARAIVGRIVVGSLSAIGASFHTSRLGPGRSYRESGEELVAGVGRPLTRWLAPLGPVGPTDSEAVRVFDPGARPAYVTIRTSRPGSSPASLELTVAAGQTVTVTAPVASGAATSGSSATAPGGTITVTSAKGVGVVVEHESYLTLSPDHVVLASSSPTVSSPATWVLPGEQQSALLAGALTITDTSATAVSVVVEQLGRGASTPLGQPPSPLTSVRVPAGRSIVVALRGLVTSRPGQFGLELRANGPILVTGGILPSSSRLQPAVESAIPAS
ncbi:MAG: hypothetical protein ACYCSF_02410 [Acidimicrobiales bacterium]